MDVSTGTVGPLLPGIRCALTVQGTADTPEGGPGELWISGPNVASGYVCVADSDAVKAKSFPLPGWYNTGDVCTIDENAFLAVVSRTKELIKYERFQASPVELDAYLNRNPLVWRVGSERVALECNYEDFAD
jgi:long-subunit acyl-CoA synthetase (AMP-forming)